MWNLLVVAVLSCKAGPGLVIDLAEELFGNVKVHVRFLASLDP